MTEDARIHHGGCHCGTVRFTVRLAEGLDRPVRCNCSYCRMKGAVMAFAPLADLALTAGADAIATYQFHSGAAKHHFCPRCGIHTHHQRRFDPTLYAVNLACLDGVSPYDFAEVPVIDGSRHPLDHGGGAMRVAGHLHYAPAPE
ncbi:MAG: GFA family protein [Sphingomonadales bacterium]|nr:GFA family protein [Sphingomonadales bacterium]